MRKLLCAVMILSLLLVWPVCASADMLVISANPFASNIISITTAEEFLAFSRDCRLDSYSIGKTVSLKADIDLAGMEFTGIPIFSGTFQGNGHQISGFHIDHDGSRQGFFRILTETAVISDLHLEGTVTPGGTASNIGGLVGINAGSLYNCSFGGTVSGLNNIGGIVGYNSMTGIIENCSVSGSVHGTHFIGGIAGNSAGVIRSCENRAVINTTIEQNAVALEDITLESLINAESSTTVTDIGGICGTNTGVIRDCTNFGSIGYPQIGYNVGGIVGTTSGYIYGCTNKGAIDGRKEVGGIAGQLVPAVSMTFAQDTLQILQEQMDTMSALTSKTASHAQSGASSLESQLLDLESHVTSVQGALDILLPDFEDGTLPDPDTILAAQNTLSSSLNAISGTLESIGTTGEDMMSTTYRDMLAISDQMNSISSTIDNAEAHLNGSVSDISDADTDADTTGKIDSCKNLASINGGWNTGGIVGAISIENDLNPDQDMDIFGSSSANFACEFRAVIVNCENSGLTTGKKQNTGGIVGWMTMGLAKNCINSGTITGVEYTGGIAGISRSYIRNCITRCLISGSTYTGGIAGLGTTLSDCSALVQLIDCKEYIGAIMGIEGAELQLENNYYLPVLRDFGAVDGISYDGQAQPLTSDAFFALEVLPESFQHMTVTFHFEDGTTKIVTVPFASKLDGEQVPAIPEMKGYEGNWSGAVAVNDALFFDTDFFITRTAHIPTLESTMCSVDGRPLLFAQGDFQQGHAIAIEAANDRWLLTLPAVAENLQLRFLLPATYKPEAVTLQIQDAAGNWSNTEFAVNGSYIVFEADSTTQALRLEKVPVNYMQYILPGLGGLILLCVIFLYHRKKHHK